jgi:hypothetical protein
MSPAPSGPLCGVLYLCGALSDDPLTEVFGDGFARVIPNDFNCWIESADEWARPAAGLKKTRPTMHGRDAVVAELQQTSELFVDAMAKTLVDLSAYLTGRSRPVAHSGDVGALVTELAPSDHGP